MVCRWALAQALVSRVVQRRDSHVPTSAIAAIASLTTIAASVAATAPCTCITAFVAASIELPMAHRHDQLDQHIWL